MFDSTGSTACRLDRVLLCDDCVIRRARRYGILGRPESELETTKRHQRELQAKLMRMRHNARQEQEYVEKLKAELAAARPPRSSGASVRADDKTSIWIRFDRDEWADYEQRTKR